MRSFMTGCAVLGLLAVGAMAPASAHVPPVRSTMHGVQPADWDDCGPRCREHRREARERERWSQHRRWEEHRSREESHRYPSYDRQSRY
jgi:hypothetical protein